MTRHIPDAARNVLRVLTGGRPMQREAFLFMDRVAGKPVYQWRDQRGRKWMAFYAWSLFRIPLDGDRL